MLRPRLETKEMPMPCPGFVRLRSLLTALLLWAGPAAAEAQYHEGTLDGADYLIGVPSDWNGGLVIYAHGYEGELPGRGNVQVSPLANYVTGKGIAWAATGFRAVSYRPDWFLDDVLTLRAHIARRFGTPRWTVIQGLSMGGHISVAALELHPDKFQGALVECGVVDGVGLVDWLYAYTAAAEYFSGVPLLDTPRPAFNTLVNERLVPALGLPGSYTERGRAFDSVVKHLAGGDVPLRLEGLARRYLLNLNPREPGPQSAREFARHADTRHIRYAIDPGFGVDGETVNHDIRRIEPPPGARSRAANPVFAELTGRLQAPLMTIHESADFRVPLAIEQNYRRKVEAAGRGDRLVQRVVAGAGHCATPGPMRERAFDDLLAWMDKGAKPKGDDLLGSVTAFGQW
jgi:pimeloyl-ACP methyl ester carboxylesterase